MMANLFWKNEQKELFSLTQQPFGTEAALEDYLYKNPQLLGDLLIISRQTKTGNHRDIPDLIAIDADGNVLIIELKKGSPSEDVISQVLRYAIWAETNPDSIKNLWLEFPDKPDDWKIDWDNITIKIMVVAEDVPVNVLRLANRIAYPFEFLEVTRFLSKDNEFVLVNPRTSEALQSINIVKGKQVWDESWYRQNFNPASAEVFMQIVGRLEKIIQNKGWKLDTKYNKSYVGFKYGYPIVFGVIWIGSKSFCLFFKLSLDQADKFRKDGYEYLRYEKEWNQVLYKVESKDISLEKYIPLIEAAYQNITGNK
jgi:hypothetical protein